MNILEFDNHNVLRIITSLQDLNISWIIPEIIKNDSNINYLHTLTSWNT